MRCAGGDEVLAVVFGHSERTVKFRTDREDTVADVKDSWYATSLQ